MPVPASRSLCSSQGALPAAALTRTVPPLRDSACRPSRPCRSGRARSGAWLCRPAVAGRAGQVGGRGWVTTVRRRSGVVQVTAAVVGSSSACQPWWWMRSWQAEQRARPLSRLVSPSWRHHRRWWIWVQPMGRPQDGPRQDRSRALTARRCAGDHTRVSRPTSRTWDGPAVTIAGHPGVAADPPGGLRGQGPGPGGLRTGQRRPTSRGRVGRAGRGRRGRSGRCRRWSGRPARTRAAGRPHRRWAGPRGPGRCRPAVPARRPGVGRGGGGGRRGCRPGRRCPGRRAGSGTGCRPRRSAVRRVATCRRHVRSG